MRLRWMAVFVSSSILYSCSGSPTDDASVRDSSEAGDAAMEAGADSSCGAPGAMCIHSSDCCSGICPLTIGSTTGSCN